MKKKAKTQAKKQVKKQNQTQNKTLGNMQDKKLGKKQMSIRTQAVHGKFLSTSWEFDHHLIPPITGTTAFRMDNLKRGAQGFLDFASGENSDDKPILIYDRLNEPNSLMLEEQLAIMESADCCFTFGSGMGAISTALLNFLKSGDKILAHHTLYGCTFSLLTNWLPRFQIETLLVDLNKDELDKQLLDPKIKLVYFESVSNPNLRLLDLKRIVKSIKEANKKRGKDNKIVSVVDNTFATPWGLRPIEWGIDVVIHSLTKNIGGFGAEMGGAIMTSKEHEQSLKVARKDFGAVLSPQSAWHIHVFGLATQPLRFERQQATALKVAQFLEKHPKVESVIYPGLPSHPQYRLARKMLRTPEGLFAPGFMIAFVLKGDMKKCEILVNDLATNSYSITLAVSLGLTKTLVEVPGFMTHSAIPKEKLEEVEIDPRGIRLSIGVESAEDIISDLNSALKKC